MEKVEEEEEGGGEEEEKESLFPIDNFSNVSQFLSTKRKQPNLQHGDRRIKLVVHFLIQSSLRLGSKK